MASRLKVVGGRAGHSISIRQSEGASQENMGAMKRVFVFFLIRKRGAQCSVGAGKGAWSMAWGRA